MTALRAVLAGIFVAALLPTGAVSAHSSLVSSCPGRGDVVNQLDRIELTFGGAIVEDDATLVALAAVGGTADVEIGPVTFVDDRTLEATVPAGLEPGRYIVRYMVTSIDGDLNDGGFEFTFDPEADQDAPGCEDDREGDGGGSGGWLLLGVGAAAMLGLVFLLRPRRSGS